MGRSILLVLVPLLAVLVVSAAFVGALADLVALYAVRWEGLTAGKRLEQRRAARLVGLGPELQAVVPASP